MVLCLCSNITSEDIQEALSAGSKNIKEIYCYLDKPAVCCTCFQLIQEEIEDYGSNNRYD